MTAWVPKALDLSLLKVLDLLSKMSSLDNKAADIQLHTPPAPRRRMPKGLSEADVDIQRHDWQCSPP